MTVLLDPRIPQDLLKACPAYEPTPLTALNWTGRDVWAKDETGRMGLGAFKALGGVYAVARLIAEASRVEATAEGLLNDETRSFASGMTFVCASAGNHGLSVAAGARIFGARCRIHLAATVPTSFEARLRAQGSEVVWSGADYEESVAAAIADAEKTGSVHLADGSWQGYTKPPRLVMEGYTVMAEEMRTRFLKNDLWPDHVYLQAGVGGLAAAIAHSIRARWEKQPEIIVVEPVAAPCLKESIAAGRILTVSGPESNMGRLDCKTPSLLAFDILKTCADRFETVSDTEALATASKVSTQGTPTTPSGAAGLAVCLREANNERNLAVLSESA